MVSGTERAITVAKPVLEALTQPPAGTLAVVGSDVGSASNFKLINQVLCAIHIAVSGCVFRLSHVLTTSEAMALGANLGVNPRKLYNALKDSSFMCE